MSDDARATSHARQNDACVAANWQGRLSHFFLNADDVLRTGYALVSACSIFSFLLPAFTTPRCKKGRQKSSGPSCHF